MAENEQPVVEAEIIDETGQVISPVSPKDHARPYGDNGGLLSGVLVLTVGFLATIAVILFSIFVIVPLMLLGRLLGINVRTHK